jgi:hypothetical protein
VAIACLPCAGPLVKLLCHSCPSPGYECTILCTTKNILLYFSSYVNIILRLDS